MCSNFDGLLDPIRFADTFGAAMPSGGRGSVWPAYPSSFVLQDKASPQIINAQRAWASLAWCRSGQRRTRNTPSWG
ncbi:MAG: hypothetical protein IPF65_06245 [Polaromonas sp.]|nr:hypothetical protein [Polaromonas sp.]